MNYCPKCGSTLVYEEEYRKCKQGHIWEIRPSCFGWNFREVKTATCQNCGELHLACHLRDVFGRQLCPTCFQVEKSNWRMDSKESYALLEITPIVAGNGKYFSYRSSIEIKPYPNPFMFGGEYGFGSAKSEEELEQVIASFNRKVDELREYGMTEVAIKRHPEKFEERQLSLEQVAIERTQPKTAKLKAKQIKLF